MTCVPAPSITWRPVILVKTLAILLGTIQPSFRKNVYVPVSCMYVTALWGSIFSLTQVPPSAVLTSRMTHPVIPLRIQTRLIHRRTLYSRLGRRIGRRLLVPATAPFRVTLTLSRRLGHFTST